MLSTVQSSKLNGRHRDVYLESSGDSYGLAPVQYLRLVIGKPHRVLDNTGSVAPSTIMRPSQTDKHKT